MLEKVTNTMVNLLAKDKFCLILQKEKKKIYTHTHTHTHTHIYCIVLYSPWNSPGQNTGVGSFSLLQKPTVVKPVKFLLFFKTQSNLECFFIRELLFNFSKKMISILPPKHRAGISKEST